MKTTGTMTITSKLNRKTGEVTVTVLVDGMKYHEFVVTSGDMAYTPTIQPVFLRNGIRLSGFLPVITNIGAST